MKLRYYLEAGSVYVESKNEPSTELTEAPSRVNADLDFDIDHPSERLDGLTRWSCRYQRTRSSNLPLMDEFFRRPILHSPYEYPGRHWQPRDLRQPTNCIRQPHGAAATLTLSWPRYGTGSFRQPPIRGPRSANSHSHRAAHQTALRPRLKPCPLHAPIGKFARTRLHPSGSSTRRQRPSSSQSLIRVHPNANPPPTPDRSIPSSPERSNIVQFPSSSLQLLPALTSHVTPPLTVQPSS